MFMDGSREMSLNTDDLSERWKLRIQNGYSYDEGYVKSMEWLSQKRKEFEFVQALPKEIEDLQKSVSRVKREYELEIEALRRMKERRAKAERDEIMQVRPVSNAPDLLADQLKREIADMQKSQSEQASLIRTLYGRLNETDHYLRVVIDAHNRLVDSLEPASPPREQAKNVEPTKNPSSQTKQAKPVDPLLRDFLGEVYPRMSQKWTRRFSK